MQEANTRDYWVHDLDPFIFQFWEGFGLRWYGLSYVVGILFAVWLLNRWARARRIPLAPGEAADFLLYTGLGMVLGGRLGYCFLYAFDHFAKDPLYLFRIWEGGMASHGGVIGIIAGAWLFGRRRKRDFFALCDQCAAVAPIGIAFGRIANFINGELWGRQTDVAWAVIFPDAARGGVNVPRHPSQLYAMFLEGILVFLVLLPIHRRHRRPGLTAASFLLVYGVGRFIGEFWREPDFGHKIFFGWMSKGQLFTLPLFAIGILWFIVAWRGGVKPKAYAAPEVAPGADAPPQKKGKAKG